METKLSKLNTYKSIRLSDEEKNAMRSHGAHVVTTMIPVVTESIFHRGMQHGLRIALSAFLFTVFVGSSVSVVANSALPGDPLYTFKVNVNEEVKGFFLKTPEEKVVAGKKRIEDRLGEMKTLAESNSLTPEKQAIVEKALNDHVKTFNASLTTLSKDSPETALTVSASLEASLKDTKEAISNTPDNAENRDKEAALKAVDGTIEQVSEQEVKIISNEIQNLENDVNTVPTANASSDISTSPQTTTPAAP